tara:strand:- start:726 stop:2150 length:1425 start_codon:yes stop_codon:yes gene_type:complete
MTKESLIIKTKPLPQSRIAIELEIPASSCKSHLDETISKISKTATIPGFRSGKIPKQILIQRIGITQLYASALEKIIEKSWNEALKIKSIEPLCEPELPEGFESLLKKFDPSKNLKFTLETDIAPELKLKKTKGLKVSIPQNKFNPKSIDEELEKSRKQLANIVPVIGRKAKLGDIAVISFEGIYKDSKEKIEGGSSESMDLELEKNKMIPGFVEGIVGMKIDSTKKLDLKFPNDYPHENSKGKEAIFEITLKDLKIRELPKLDDSFAKQSGNKETLKELKKDIEIKLKDNFKKNQESIKNDALIDALSKELDVEIPKSLIDNEVRNNIEQTAQRFAQQGMDIKSTFTPELVKSLAESSRPQAEENVIKNLALKALSEIENITVDDKEIDLKIDEFKDEIEKSANDIDIEKFRSAIKSDLLTEKLISWLDENSQVTEKVESKEKAKKIKKTDAKSNSKEVASKVKKKSTKSKEK